MADKVLWETADDIDEESLQQASYDGFVGFVVEGFGITSGDVDTGANTVDIPRGHAKLVDDSFTPPRVVHAFKDATTNEPLASGTGDNYVYLVVDQASDETISYQIETNTTVISDPNLLIAVVNGNSGSVDLYNENPERSLKAPHSVTSESGATYLNVTSDGTVNFNANAIDQAVPDRVAQRLRDPRQ